ncbi:hypothetical protein JR316_0008958 [Psilocybe cubensis]|uniref:Uncharacterized protein n=1 Tax=Psilocybe cubensis TaxID=181762 RepID=A0ACB8GRY6_PSICU|nr:hypothetical protein JR316_0008958 [Psilocybe cubensis]KAH9478503.1 hypothetical protein JR316_0008958 [Psilocybe cubensis]
MSSHSSQQQHLIPSSHKATDHVSYLNKLNEVLLAINELEGHLIDERNDEIKARYKSRIENLKKGVLLEKRGLENRVLPTDAAMKSLEQGIELIFREYENDSGYYRELMRTKAQQKRLKQEAMEAKRLNRRSNSSIGAMFASTSSESLYLPPGRKMSPEEFRYPQNYFHAQTGTSGSSATQPSHPRNKTFLEVQEYPSNSDPARSVSHQGTQKSGAGKAFEEQSTSAPHVSVELANNYPGPYVRPGDDGTSYTASSLVDAHVQAHQQQVNGFNLARNIDASRGHRGGEV